MERRIDNAYIANELLKMAKVYINDKYRYKTYKTASDKIKKHSTPILSGAQAKQEIVGVGDSVGKKIDEILSSGQPMELANLRVETKERLAVLELFQSIHGVGKGKAEEWYDKNYRTLQDLYPLYQNSVMNNAQKIGYFYYYDFQERIPRAELDLTNRIFKSIFSNPHGSEDPLFKFEFAGSYRRGLESSGDLDVLFCSAKSDGSPLTFGDIVNVLTNSGFIVAHLTESPVTKYMGVFKVNQNSKARRIDIRLIPPQSWATSLLYFTGSKQFNILIRNRALSIGYSLSEYGMQKAVPSDVIPEPPSFSTELDIFSFLGLKYLSPKERLDDLTSLEIINPQVQYQDNHVSVVIEPKPELINIKLLHAHNNHINWENSRLAIFDLDGTLIRNCHGKVFSMEVNEIEIMPNRREIMLNLYQNNYSLLIVSNQKVGGNRKIVSIHNKLVKALELLDLPCVLFAALMDDSCRKPNTGIWKFIEDRFPKLNKNESFFCGDAAGREGDFSDSDLKFAQNVGLPFFTPETLFEQP